MNYLKALKRKSRKQRDNFIAQFEFKPARELPFTIEEIADAVESNRIIHLEFNGRKQFPTFQFDGQGSVYPALKEHLPRLLSSDWNAWEVCFWLYREHAVVLKQLKPNASQLEGVANIDEVLRISKRAAELTETCVARPIDLAISGNNEALSAFVESWLAPDRRDIPEPAVPKKFLGVVFGEQSSKPENDSESWFMSKIQVITNRLSDLNAGVEEKAQLLVELNGIRLDV